MSCSSAYNVILTTRYSGPLAITDFREQVTHNNNTCINPWSVRKMYSIYVADFLFNCFIKSYGAIKPLGFLRHFPEIWNLPNALFAC